MFKERSGVSAVGLGVILSVRLIVTMIADIPTGVVADIYSKKYSIVTGRLLRCLAFVIWLVSPN